MIDLPPTLPVIAECADAVVESWQAAEACILELGYARSEPSAYWTQVETDYWGAIKLSFQNYNLAGDEQQTENIAAKILESEGFEVMPDDQPFLTTGYRLGNYVSPSEVTRLYVKDKNSAVVLLNGEASTSITVFSSQPWANFDQFWRNAPTDVFDRTDKIPVRRVEADWPTCRASDGKLYAADDYTDCETIATFDILHTNGTTFEQFLRRQSDFSFQASFGTIRE